MARQRRPSGNPNSRSALGEYENAIDSRAITSTTCWDALKSDLKAELVKNSGSYYRDNTCAVLKAKGEL